MVSRPTLVAFSKEFLSTYAVNNNKPSSIESKRYMLEMHLVPALGCHRLDEIGQKEIEMTMRYAHLSPDVKRDAVQLLDRRSYGNLTATEAVLAANTAKRAQKKVSPTGFEAATARIRRWSLIASR